MTLLGRVAAALRANQTEFAVIGAAAMAAHGVGRSTLDIDLLSIDQTLLRDTVWQRMDANVDVRRGDADDPLAGVVRIVAPGERPVDLIIGRLPWQADIVRRAQPATISDVVVPVADAAGLIMLKLYAGGTQDAWDIEQLLGAASDRQTLVAGVDAAVQHLPDAGRALWQRLR